MEKAKHDSMNSISARYAEFNAFLKQTEEKLNKRREQIKKDSDDIDAMRARLKASK